jgi:hypothetical protein
LTPRRYHRNHRISVQLLPIAALLFAARGAHARTPAGPFAGDARLDRKVSLRFLNRPVRDVLADINQLTGIRLFSDAVVSDNRLSLLTHDRPLGEILAGVASFYRWEWRRDSKPGAKSLPGYTLLQTESAAKADSDYVETRLSRLAALLKKEADVYETLSQLDQKQREILEDQVPTAIAREKDPDKRETLKVQTIALQDMRERRLWKPVIYRLIASLTPTQLSSLARNSNTAFAWPQTPGCLPIPDARYQELKQVFARDVVPSGVPRGEIGSVRLRFTLVAGRLPYLRTSVLIGQKTSYGISTYGMVTPMPASYSLLSDEGAVLPRIEPEGWRNDAALLRPVSIHLPDSPSDPPKEPENRPAGAVRRAELQGPAPQIWLTDALLKLDESVPMDVISDGLWSSRLPGIDAVNAPLGEVLTKLGRACGHRWWKQDGFVMMQSRTLSADRWAEPPATAVTRWSELIDHGEFGLDEFAEIAALPDAQAMTLQEMSASEQFPLFLSPLSSARGQLLLWHDLTPAQRRKALGSAGLPYSEMTPQQQQDFVLAATDPSASLQSSAVPDAAFLSRARLRIETQERACWGVHRAGPFATWRIPRGSDPDNAVEKREEAVRKFVASDSSIRPDDIQAMTLIVHRFIYETTKEPLSVAVVQMPARWEPN